MKKISDYKRHAEECRQLAIAAALPEHRAQLVRMAETWDMLAEQREREVARQQRLENLANLVTPPGVPHQKNGKGPSS